MDLTLNQFLHKREVKHLQHKRQNNSVSLIAVINESTPKIFKNNE
jgi:hypothetical protein